MNQSKEFYKYAIMHKGISSSNMDRYIKNTNKFVQPTDYYISPNIIEERTMNMAVLDVHSRLMMDRILFLGVPIDSTVANIVQAQLLFLESVDNSRDIQIYLNTPGGEVTAGLGILDVMNYVSPDISVVVTGMAASMGAVILSAGTKGKRTSLKHSRIMIHQPSGGMGGQATDMEITLREILKLKRELYEILSENTGKTYEEIERDSDRDYWMTSQEALEYGIIDEILERKHEIKK